MTTLLYIVAIVVVLIVAIVIVISLRPSAFRIERTAQIDAPADIVFPQINDFHKWVQWSPFEKLDPNMTKTFEGPTSGPGAIYCWSGNKNAGAGRITIFDAKPNEQVKMKLEFFKPFAATNQVTFLLTPSGVGTQVSWIMEGTMNFMLKVFTLFMSMDSMVGKDFEHGLANLNRVAQAAKTEGGRSTAPV